MFHDGDQWRALGNTVMNLRVPESVGKFLSSCRTGGFSRRESVNYVCFTENGGSAIAFRTVYLIHR
jgi:hypothetical protein